MPTVTEQRVDGWVSCIDPRCAGYEQRPVEVLKRTTSFSYQDLGGDGSVPQTAIEREAVGVVQTDEACEHCGKPCVFSDAPRPEYAAVSGQDPLELLAISQQTQVRDVQLRGLERDKEIAEMRIREAERDAREAERDRLFADMKAELDRRKGGRPRKEPEGDE